MLKLRDRKNVRFSDAEFHTMMLIDLMRIKAIILQGRESDNPLGS